MTTRLDRKAMAIGWERPGGREKGKGGRGMVLPKGECLWKGGKEGGARIGG